jgi:NitT/TauT family transport system permease protein
MSGRGSAAGRNPSSLARLSRLLRSKYAIALVTVSVLLGLWQAFGPIQPLFASYPSQIIDAAFKAFIPDVIPSWQSTLIGYFVGITVSIPVAITVGVAMGRVELVDLILAPYVNALYVTPRIALIPVLVLWFGLDFNLRVAIVVLSSVFPMIVNTYAGMKQVDVALLDVGRVFTANGRQRLFTIILPGSLPYIFAGLRLGTARALGGVIVAEMTASFSGIGRRLINYGTFFEIDRMFVAVISIGIVGLLIARGLAFAQGRVAPWTHAVRTR